METTTTKTMNVAIAFKREEIELIIKTMNSLIEITTNLLKQSDMPIHVFKLVYETFIKPREKIIKFLENSL